jgi:hypothetical protein
MRPIRDQKETYLFATVYCANSELFWLEIFYIFGNLVPTLCLYVCPSLSSCCFFDQCYYFKNRGRFFHSNKQAG